MNALITDIQRFSLSDGPGIRTSVFFKGCNMHCDWCHNPETLDGKSDIMLHPDRCIGCGKCFSVCPTGARNGEGIDRSLCVRCGKCADVCYAEAIEKSGKLMSVEEVMAEIVQDKAYYQSSGGGVTLTGGEVLCHIPFAVALAEACHKEGISVAIESNLSLPYETIVPLISVCDLIMADIKLFDNEAHVRHTGVSNHHVLDNVRRITDVPMIIRTPLIPGATATEKNIRAIGQFLAGKSNLRYYQLLNFNPLGASKYEGLGRKNPYADAHPFGDEDMKTFAAWAAEYSIPVKVGE